MADAPWKVKQYCYFWIASDVLTAADIGDALGVLPDRTSVMGSRRTSPRTVPPEHRWEIVCDRHGRIDEQASELLTRLEPVAARVRTLVDRGDVGAGLMMVRYFDDEDGGYGAMSWWLSRQQVALLADMGAVIDADEYAGDYTAHSPS
jgi:hypothetical protein